MANLWQPAEEKQKDFEETWDRSLELLFSQGYCYWRCELFRGEIIKIVIDDSIKSFKYPVWTLEELLLAADLRPSTLKLVQAAKRHRTGARLISVEDRK